MMRERLICLHDPRDLTLFAVYLAYDTPQRGA